MELPKKKSPEKKREFVDKYHALVQENEGKQPPIDALFDLIFEKPRRIKRTKEKES